MGTPDVNCARKIR